MYCLKLFMAFLKIDVSIAMFVEFGFGFFAHSINQTGVESFFIRVPLYHSALEKMCAPDHSVHFENLITCRSVFIERRSPSSRFASGCLW